MTLSLLQKIPQTNFKLFVPENAGAVRKGHACNASRCSRPGKITTRLLCALVVGCDALFFMDDVEAHATHY